MRQRQHLTLGSVLVALALGLVFVVSGQGQGTLPASDLAKLISQDVKTIESDLSKPTFSKKGQKQVRMAAFMIALYAQNAKDNSPAMATLRDQALGLMKAASAGKADEAKKIASTLTMDIKPNSAAQISPVALEKQLDLETLMGMFNSDKVGGFGMEKALEDLVDAKKLDAAQFEQTALLGQKVALIAKVTRESSPKKELDAKNKKVWSDLASEMQAEAGALTAAAQAKKDADIGKIANKLTASCTKCHDMFR